MVPRAVLVDQGRSGAVAAVPGLLQPDQGQQAPLESPGRSTAGDQPRPHPHASPASPYAAYIPCSVCSKVILPPRRLVFLLGFGSLAGVLTVLSAWLSACPSDLPSSGGAVDPRGLVRVLRQLQPHVSARAAAARPAHQPVHVPAALGAVLPL